MIYGKSYNCQKHPWLLKHKAGEAAAQEQTVDIYKDDKEQARKEINQIMEEKTSMLATQFGGNETTITNNTIDALTSQERILLRNAMLKHKDKDYYIKYDYLFKTEDAIYIFYILYKDLAKAIKDYNTKLTLIPKILYTTDILKSNFPKHRIVTKAIYLNVDEFVFGNISESDFSDNDISKHTPLYAELEGDEPTTVYSRKCKKCEYRNYCGVPTMSVVDLETTPNCWRKIDPIVKENKTLELDSLTEQQLNSLTDRQLARYKAAKSKDGVYLDKSIIQSFLDVLNTKGYISFDFETYSSMKPFSEKYTNYSQIPFSFSMDIVDTNDSVIKHSDYIIDYKENSFDELVDILVSVMPTDLPIVVYFKTFEISRLKEMQGLYPQHSEVIQKWIDNIVDLYDVFSDGGYYDTKFNNSVSLKNVYPVLCNSNQYENLAINHGDEAALQYKRVFNSKQEKDADIIVNSLMDYNRQDTLAQVEIIQILKEIIKK